MNSFQNLASNKEGYQMIEQGPDSYVINYKKIENCIGLKWKVKPMAKFLPLKRKNST